MALVPLGTMLSQLELLTVVMLVVVGAGISDRRSDRAVAVVPAARTSAPQNAFSDPTE
jgi:hypothetical protein